MSLYRTGKVNSKEKNNSLFTASNLNKKSQPKTIENKELHGANITKSPLDDFHTEISGIADYFPVIGAA